MDQLLLALDYGGTKHSAAILRARRADVGGACAGRLAGEPRRRLRSGRPFCGWRAELLAQVRGRLVAVGVSFGGPVDAGRGLVRLSHHVPGWEEVPLAQRLEQASSAPLQRSITMAMSPRSASGVSVRAREPKACCTSPSAPGSAAAGCWAGASGAARTAWPARSGTCVVRPGGMPCVCGKRGLRRGRGVRPGHGPQSGRTAGCRERRRRSLLEVSGRPGGGDNRRAGGRVPQTGGDELARAVLDDAAAALGLGSARPINLREPERGGAWAAG